MMTKTWLLLNAALLLLAAISINSLVKLPATLKRQKELTAAAIKGTEKDKGASSTANAKSPKGFSRRSISRQTPQAHQPAADTWPQIRRGSLATLWKQSLFSKDRTESFTGETLEELKKDDEALPAPPNFELIGILTANEAKVAIIELKSNSAANRQAGQRMMRRPMGRPEPTPAPSTANAAEAFTPSFVTAHEDEPLKETGFKVISIDAAANTVTLSKDGLDYRLKLDRNSSNAAQRKDSQNTYAQSVKDKAKAAEIKQQTAQQQQQQQAPQQQQQGMPNGGMPPMPPGGMPVMPNNRGIPQRPTRPGFTSNGTQPLGTPTQTTTNGNAPNTFRQPGVRFNRGIQARQQ